ncbi:MAG: PorT family protein [Sphingobacteriales bacterium]|nr:MAG: PorT family protein [Sphingobacteriales bacterium]
MKKLFFTLLTFSIPAMMHAQLTGAAQSVLPVKIDLGIKVGANFSKLDGKTWQEAYKGGVLGGVFVGLHRKKIGVSAEALFSQTKYEINSPLPSSFYNNAADTGKSVNVRATYLNIPVLFNYKLFSMAWLQIGPQYSGVVSLNDKDDFLKDAKGLFKGGDISGVIGLQINLPVKLNIGARYILGFTDQNSGNNAAVTDAWKNRSIQLHVGYSFL